MPDVTPHKARPTVEVVYDAEAVAAITLLKPIIADVVEYRARGDAWKSSGYPFGDALIASRVAEAAAIILRIERDVRREPRNAGLARAGECLVELGTAIDALDAFVEAWNA